jgi:hypothetical protein
MAEMLTKKEVVTAVAQKMQGKDLSAQAVGVLRRSTEKVLERIKQNVDAQVKEDSYPVIEQFCQKVSNRLSAMTQQWVDGVSNDLVVFPEGTRYIFRDGELTTIVVEQQPQNRHIDFGAYGGTPANIKMLAMPYVQFIMSFRNHQPQGALHVGMTKKPLTDLDGMIFNPILPNITHHQVCMGNTKWPDKGTMTDKVNGIISGFWQSQFNDAGNQDFVAFLAANNLTVESWQEKSKADPTFILGKGIKFNHGLTVRRFLATDDKNGTKGKISLVQNIKTELIDAVGVIGGDLQKLLTTVDLKTENREKPHIDVLQDVLKEIITQAYEELWEFMLTQLQQERLKMQSEIEVAANKLKKDFQYFMENTADKKAPKRTW